jgi:L-threonylcarbamoyladenylate synthase
VIRAGGLVAFPTETVYGLGACALEEAAVRRIYLAKQRPAEDPCIVHLASAEDLGRVSPLDAAPPALMQRLAILAQHCWPGPLSVIVARAAAIPDVVTASRSTVAVRIPAHPVAQALIRAAGVPIAAPSANTFTHTSPTTAHHVLDDLSGRIDLVLDGGTTWVGVESTVLDLTGAVPVVLRPGGVDLETLRTLLGDVQTHDARSPDQPTLESGGLIAPGLLEKHYAPRASVLLLDGSAQAVRHDLVRRARTLLEQGHRVGALVFDDDALALEGLTARGLCLARLGASGDLLATARRLYAGMRELEAAGVEVILTRTVGEEGLGRAIQDRLTRAAGGRVVPVRA